MTDRGAGCGKAACPVLRGAGSQPGPRARSCGTARKLGGKQRTQTSPYRPGSARPTQNSDAFLEQRATAMFRSSDQPRDSDSKREPLWEASLSKAVLVVAPLVGHHTPGIPRPISARQWSEDRCGCLDLEVCATRASDLPGRERTLVGIRSMSCASGSPARVPASWHGIGLSKSVHLLFPRCFEYGDPHMYAIRVRSVSRGFTLMELMIVVAIIAILAAIAIPSYDDYNRRSRARNATVDLMTLSVALENEFQRTLSYPTLNLVGTANVTDRFTTWSPSQGAFFSFSVQSSTGNYTLTAAGTGSMTGCDLTLEQDNSCTVSSPSICGIPEC